ncbi:MAG: TraR/DksA C4-type zinc finger protein [Chitinophagaceae bacterium]
MAVKKKAVKPAKKAPAKPAPHKAGKPAPAPAKKPVAKSVPHKTGKPAPKPVPVPKKAVKPVAKPAPAKVAPVAKPASKPLTKKSVPPPTAKSVIKPKADSAPVKKPEVKKPEPVAAAPAKPYVPPKPTFKPVTNTPAPVPKKQAVTDKPAKVVMPEIKTKTVRKYQPDFTKSVLDQPTEQSSGPTMRYSDAELTEFREIITKKLDAAKKELAYLQGLITRKDEMGGDNDDGRYMTMEDGGMSMEREQLSQMASRQISFIDHLEKAMMRIENKTYGICRVTGKLIDKARLRAVPHATLSIEAKQMMNK